MEKQTAMEKAQKNLKNNKLREQNRTRGAVQGFTAMLENPKAQSEIIKACTRHITPERLMRIAKTAANRQPELWNCSPLSFIGAIIDCAQLGLEPIQSLGHCYLIPYRNNKNGGQMEVQVQLGYKGMIALAMRSGKFEHLFADTIGENDQILEYEEGTNATLRIKPAFPKPSGELKGAYCVATLKNSQSPPLFKLIDMAVIEDARARSMDYNRWLKKGKTGRTPIWEEHLNAMAMKTAIRRLSPFLSMSPELQSFFEVDAKKEVGIDADYKSITGLITDSSNFVEVEPMEEEEDASNNLQE